MHRWWKNLRRRHKGDQKEEETTESFKLCPDDAESQLLDNLCNFSLCFRLLDSQPSLCGQKYTLIYIFEQLRADEMDVSRLQVYLSSKSDSDNYMQLSGKPSFHQSYSNGLLSHYYSIRATLWKVATGYLPSRKQRWISRMEGGLIKYRAYIRDHIVEKTLKRRHLAGKGLTSSNKQLEQGSPKLPPDLKAVKQLNISSILQPVSSEKKQPNIKCDHPLNQKNTSTWRSFFSDSQLWNTIEKDTRRTRRNHKFFDSQHQFSLTENDYESTLNPANYRLSESVTTTSTYRDCLTRMLFIFHKNHPELDYCQGENELACLILYSFNHQNSEYFRRVAESDSYFVMERVLLTLIDPASKTLLSGDRYAILFEEALRRVDPKLMEVMNENQQINPLRTISLRWFAVAFLTEFELDNILRLWDGLIVFCQQHNKDSQGPKGNEGVLTWNKMPLKSFLIYIGLALLHLNRRQLIEGVPLMELFSPIKDSPQDILNKAYSLQKLFPTAIS